MAETLTVAPPQQAGQTKDSVMATTLIGAHGLEHLYGHSFPVLVTALYTDLGLNPRIVPVGTQVGVVVL